jgi:hypothetical protein
VPTGTSKKLASITQHWTAANHFEYLSIVQMAKGPGSIIRSKSLILMAVRAARAKGCNDEISALARRRKTAAGARIADSARLE